MAWGNTRNGASIASLYIRSIIFMNVSFELPLYYGAGCISRDYQDSSDLEARSRNPRRPIVSTFNVPVAKMYLILTNYEYYYLHT
jgi:hypothetical protein